jgi:hypothetical protein
MEPILSDLTGELNLGNRCKSLDFRTSGPSPDPSLRRLEYGLVDVVENLRFQRISDFH